MLYGYGIWSFTLREKRRLWLFENRLLRRRILGAKKDENGEWGNLHNEELYSLTHSLNKIRVIKSRRLRWAGPVAKMEEGRSALNISEKIREKRLLGRRK